MKQIILTIALILLGLEAYALPLGESDSTNILRPVNASYALQIGSIQNTDTYLSPIKYKGWNIGFNYQRRQALKFNPGNWISQLRIDLDINKTLNVAKNAAMWYAGVDFCYSILRRWKLSKGFSLGIGPSAELNGGCLYLNRNGNNPASAKASITINADGYAAWNGNICNLPITLRYQASIPITGIFFSPDYGELYYEIYLGNHSGLCHWAWPGNFFRLRHWLTADIHLGNTSVQLGYVGEIFSSKANNIVTQTISHGAMIGISGEWLSVNTRNKISSDAKIISATY